MLKRIYVPLSLFLLAWLFTGCNSAKLSTADGQFRRGEYFAAAATYRKVYNKTSPRKERALRGKIAFRMATCYRMLTPLLVVPGRIKMRSDTIIRIVRLIYIWVERFKCRANIKMR